MGKKIMCWLGLHKEFGVTIGGYIRCYKCGKDYDFIDHKWIDHTLFLTKFMIIEWELEEKPLRTVLRPIAVTNLQKDDHETTNKGK